MIEFHNRLIEQCNFSADVQTIDSGLSGGGPGSNPVDGIVQREIRIIIRWIVVLVLEIGLNLPPLADYPLAVGERGDYVVKGLPRGNLLYKQKC